MDQDTMLGQLIEGYQIISQIGEGAMGRVYLAKHAMIGKRIAIKCLKPELVRTHVQMTRFLREAQTVNEIGHQNVVDIFNFIYRQETKEAFILMEVLEGKTLADTMEQDGVLEVQRVAHIGQQVCSALAAAHERGIIHRDLKPENVFLTERNGQKDFVKLIDFGLAKLRESGDAKPLTFHGTLLGTPAYMSPEQALGEAIDLRADIYSLALVLFEALTGVLPFASKTLQETLAGRLLFQAPSPRSYRDDVPEELEAILLKCLSKSRDDRYSSAKDLGEDLARVAKNEPSVFSKIRSSGSLRAEHPSVHGADNPWDEPELTVHQELAQSEPPQEPTTLNGARIDDPMLSSRTLMADNPWGEVTQNVGFSKMELKEVTPTPDKKTPNMERTTIEELLNDSQESIPSSEFIVEDIDNDVDIATPVQPWDDIKLKK
jgi:serine/threonine protein kinase